MVAGLVSRTAPKGSWLIARGLVPGNPRHRSLSPNGAQEKNWSPFSCAPSELDPHGPICSLGPRPQAIVLRAFSAPFLTVENTESVEELIYLFQSQSGNSSNSVSFVADQRVAFPF